MLFPKNCTFPESNFHQKVYFSLLPHLCISVRKKKNTIIFIFRNYDDGIHIIQITYYCWAVYIFQSIVRGKALISTLKSAEVHKTDASV